jgi:hypothetical protein
MLIWNLLAQDFSKVPQTYEGVLQTSILIAEIPVGWILRCHGNLTVIEDPEHKWNPSVYGISEEGQK